MTIRCHRYHHLNVLFRQLIHVHLKQYWHGRYSLTVDWMISQIFPQSAWIPVRTSFRRWVLFVSPRACPIKRAVGCIFMSTTCQFIHVCLHEFFLLSFVATSSFFHIMPEASLYAGCKGRWEMFSFLFHTTIRLCLCIITVWVVILFPFSTTVFLLFILLLHDVFEPLSTTSKASASFR